jgi:hypothetical protein
MVTSTSGVVSDKQDLLQAIDSALDFFNLWAQEGQLTKEQFQVLSVYYKENRGRVETGGPPTEPMTLRNRGVCWGCRAVVDPQTAEFCPECGVPLQSREVERLRYLVFLCHEIKKHEKAGRINLATAHDLMAEGNDRIAALRQKLEKERIPFVQVAPHPTPPPRPLPEAVPAAKAASSQRKKRTERAETVSPIDEEPATPRRSVVEILLDPRTIQWLLASGGVLLVLGLIIWLAAVGLFENKIAVAVILGTANAVLLGGGWSLTSFTRYQIAGRAVTLLACLVMPLNIWFYDYQGLIELKHGGPLWFPALVCCVLYLASAWLLKDPMFVPVFVGGIVMTGLLLLADNLFLRFWEITAPSTLLVVLGLACIHVERLFPPSDGPFSRRKFGLAFFWSGHAVLACGLLLLFVAQLFGGWLFPILDQLNKTFGTTFAQPEVARAGFGRWLALVLVLAGTYAYTYSDIVVRRIGVYIFVAVFTLLWAEVLLVTIFADLFTIDAIEIVIVALAITGLLSNFVITSLAKGQQTLQRVGAPLALFLCAVPVLLGVVLQIQGTITLRDLHHALDWPYVFAMAVTAVSCRAGAYLYRHERKGISTTYFFGAAAATLAAVAGMLVVANQPKGMPWHEQAPLLMIIPILYLIASRLYRGHTAEQPLGWVAHAATAVMVIVSFLVGTYELFQKEPEHRKFLYLWLAAFFSEATVFYAVAALTREKAANVYFCTVAAFLAVWQLFNYFGLPSEYYTLTFAGVGLVLLVLYRFAVLEKYGGGLAEASFQCANAMLLLAFTAALLITGTEMLLHFDEVIRPLSDTTSAKPLLVTMLLMMVATSLIAVVLVRQRLWRRAYVASSIINAALAVLVLVTLGALTLSQKLEVAVVVVGLLLLGAGHVGWYREQAQHNDLVSTALILGSLMTAGAFTSAVVAGRWTVTIDILKGHSTNEYNTWFYTLNEIGMLMFGLLLLGSGYASQLKATTVAGAFMTVAWILSLVLLVRFPEGLKTPAVYLMIGGGLFFLTGLVLSIYRDRLLTLPERVKRREGVFRVLSWR